MESEAAELKPGNQKNVSIVMKSLATAGNEVVVTALGIKRSPRSLGYSTQKVSGSDLTVAQAPTIAQGLMGKVAGLNVTQASGGVEGGSSRIVIRGNTNLTGDNRALIIVDGVPVNNQPLNQPPDGNNLGTNLGSDVSGYNDWGTGMNFINEEDIESVTVLKGPTAAALYGNRGANGVILITRKKGTKRSGLGIDYSFNDRFTSVYNNFYNFQNEYGVGFDASLWTADNAKKFPVNTNGQRYLPQVYGPDNAGNYTGGAGGYLPYDNAVQAYGTPYSYPGGPSWGAKFDNQPVLWYDGVQRPYSAQPNNWKAFFPDGYVSQHNVSVSGGSDFGSIRLSYTREDNKANVLNSNYNSNVFNLGSSIKISSKLTADITASYVNYQRLNTPPIGNSYVAAPIYAMTRDYQPGVELANDFMPDGSQRSVTNSSNFPAGSPPYPFNGGYVDNVFWSIYKNNTRFKHNDLTAGLKLTANLTDWLTLTAQGGIDHGNDLSETKNYPTDIQGLAGGKYALTTERDQTRDLLGLARVYKNNAWGKDINLSFTAGGESVDVNNSGLISNTNGNFINPFLFYLGNGANPVSTNNTKYAYRINSLLGIADVSYKNYLFFQFTGRNDWNSTLKSDFNSFFYPAASLAYVFTDGIKGLKESISWLSFGKLSLAYAGTGSGTTPYATNTVLDGANYNGTAALSYQNILSDPNIKPQRTREVDLSLNLGFFNNRLNIELTGYTGNSYPQIVTNPLPLSSGVNNIRINDAKLSNKGLEFVINATPITTRDFSWSIGINGAHATNKLISLSGEDSVLTLGTYFGGNGISQRVRVGDNYGTLYGRDFTYGKNGQKIVSYINDANGNPMQYTANGETYYAATQWALTSNEVPIGNSQPKLTGGISNTLRYKNFSLYFLTDFKLGGDTYFGSYGAAMGFGLRKETVKERDGGGLPYTYPDGTTDKSGMIMQGSFADGTPNTLVIPAAWYYTSSYSSWNHIGVPRSTAVFENSWMKLREVNLSYQIPRSIITKTKVFQGLSVSLIGRDLFYIFTTIPKGLNPEGVNGIGNMQGIEYAAMPNTRSFGFSVKASF
ncbi:MAG: SusC/RagA family TonB-linked outer membrane protein [Bacteroidota bacterium]